MKLQVSLNKDSRLRRHFDSVVADRAEEARRLMLLGLRVESIESVIERTIKESVAGLNLASAAPVELPDGAEDAAAAAALDASAGEWFDE